MASRYFNGVSAVNPQLRRTPLHTNYKHINKGKVAGNIHLILVEKAAFDVLYSGE
jgi:hypothetical protein